MTTNILDNNVIATNEFKELYVKRWNIETLYNLIKNRLLLENFTGYSYDAIMQDFYVTMLFTNLETMYTFDIKREFLVKLDKYIGEEKIDVVIAKDKNRLIEQEALKRGVEL